MGKRWSRQNAKRPRMTLVVAGMIAMVGGPGVRPSAGHGFAVTPLLRTPLAADTSQEVLIRDRTVRAGGHDWPSLGITATSICDGDRGTVEVVTDGQPPRRYTAGEAYHNTRGVVHETRKYRGKHGREW
jgi:hypothetical protein